MITASLRASATFAFFMPARLASRIAQLLRAVQPLSGWVRMMWPLVERRSHSLVADLADPASDVRFTRLILLGGQPEMRPNPLRRFKPRGIIDCRNISERHNRADAGRRRHQQPHPSVSTCDRPHPLLEAGELAPRGLVDHEERRRNNLQGCVALDQFP